MGWNPHQQQIVDSVIADLDWLAKHEWLENYLSERPYQQPTRAEVHAGHRFSGDCTGTIKLVVCGWNRVPPFDGERNGYGDTETFWKGPRVYHVTGGVAHWQPLDILLYKTHPGPFQGGPHEHATILTRKSRGVWQCFSMGGDHDPTEQPWNYRQDLAAVVRFPIPLK